MAYAQRRISSHGKGKLSYPKRKGQNMNRQLREQFEWLLVTPPSTERWVRAVQTLAAGQGVALSDSIQTELSILVRRGLLQHQLDELLRALHQLTRGSSNGNEGAVSSTGGQLLSEIAAVRRELIEAPLGNAGLVVNWVEQALNTRPVRPSL